MRPGIDDRNGIRFPEQPSSGNCIPEFMLGMGHTVLLTLERKVGPGILPQKGTQFPFGRGFGKSVPFRVFIPGRCFRQSVQWESVSQIGKMRRGNAWLNSPYRSTSLSHVGSAVCLTPAVCSLFASTPAERTSLMVKRMSG